ncbi:MAG TPA: ATP-binding protein, partial [Tenuifilaceae bacterium]|nr:ATP-binding protein [Tenuifilaceae bacterium]
MLYLWRNMIPNKMTIIGRQEEIKSFQKVYGSKRSELIALYGRRRVGKTFLVRELFRKELFFEVTGLYQGDMRDQLRNFSKSLALKNSEIPKDWYSAFEALEKRISRSKSKQKKVIFIDEFPWLDTGLTPYKSDFRIDGSTTVF